MLRTTHWSDDETAKRVASLDKVMPDTIASPTLNTSSTFPVLHSSLQTLLLLARKSSSAFFITIADTGSSLLIVESFKIAFSK